MSSVDSSVNSFSIKFIRLLMRNNVASDVGSEGFALLSVIAVSESPENRECARFFDTELCRVAGLSSPLILESARNRCVQSGWLRFDLGESNCPSSYRVLIPVRGRKPDERIELLDEALGLETFR